MPIHDLGYRAWQGRTTPQPFRWWVIAQAGIKIAWKSFWLRRLLFLAWVPAFYFGLGFFLYEQWITRLADWAAQQAGADKEIAPLLRDVLSGRPLENVPAAQRRMVAMAAAMVQPRLQDRVIEEGRRRLQAFLPGLPATMDRHQVWCWLMWMFFRYPQGLLMLLIVGLVAPPLIASDLSSRAFLLYFSRPIVCAEYILGKLCTLWVFLLLISTAPALVLYLLGVLLSPNLSVVVHTWDLPLRILAASVVLLVPTTTLALALSSATTKSWVAGFAWFAVWVFGLMAYNVIWASVDLRNQMQGEVLGQQWTLLSLYHTLGKVQGWIFGTEGGFPSVFPSVVLLAALTAVSLVVLARRVLSPMRI